MAHNYLLKKANIDKWIRSYISSTFKRRKFFYHIEEKHLNKSSDYLKDRCKKKKGSASTFIGYKDDVISLIVEALLEDADAISAYLADDTDTEEYIVYGDLTPSVSGIVFQYHGHNWNQGPLKCSEFVVLITKLRNNENGFAIKTAHPIPPEM